MRKISQVFVAFRCTCILFYAIYKNAWESSIAVNSSLRFLGATSSTMDSKFVSSRERKTSLKVHLSLVPVSSLPGDEFTLIGRSRFHDASPSNGLTYGALKTPLERARQRRFERPIGKLFFLFLLVLVWPDKTITFRRRRIFRYVPQRYINTR